MDPSVCQLAQVSFVNPGNSFKCELVKQMFLHNTPMILHHSITFYQYISAEGKILETSKGFSSKDNIGCVGRKNSFNWGRGGQTYFNWGEGVHC